jgi:large subunit ribosomal protein L19
MRGRIEQIEKALLPKRRAPKFLPGDTVQVHLKVREGDKERVQIFEGLMIAHRGAGPGESFTVRKVVQGEGIERIFMLNSPRIAKIVVKKRGKVRRAKLYYLRGKVGRAGRVEEVFGTAGELAREQAEAEAAERAADSVGEAEKKEAEGAEVQAAKK